MSFVSDCFWWVTVPARWGRLQARRLRDEGAASRLKALVKKIASPVVKRALAFVNTRPELRQRIINLSHRLGLYKKIHQLYWILQKQNHTVLPPVANYLITNEDASLSPRARQIYSDLKTVIEKNKEAH